LIIISARGSHPSAKKSKRRRITTFTLPSPTAFQPLLQTKVEINEELNAEILATRKEAWPIFKGLLSNSPTCCAQSLFCYILRDLCNL